MPFDYKEYLKHIVIDKVSEGLDDLTEALEKASDYVEELHKKFLAGVEQYGLSVDKVDDETALKCPAGFPIYEWNVDAAKRALASDGKYNISFKYPSLAFTSFEDAKNIIMRPETIYETSVYGIDVGINDYRSFRFDKIIGDITLVKSNA